MVFRIVFKNSRNVSLNQILIMLLSINCRNDFQDYVDLCFKEFGDRVKHWITLNEPHSFTLIVDAFGIIPRECSKKHDVRLDCLGDDSGTRVYIVGHNELLAHAATVKVYKTKYQVLSHNYSTKSYLPLLYYSTQH